MEKLSVALKLPMIKLCDGASGGGSVTTIKKAGWSYVPTVEAFPHVVRQLNQGIPNLGAILGPAIGIGAARVVMCHFVVMAGNIGSLFNAGPNVVAGKITSMFEMERKASYITQVRRLKKACLLLNSAAHPCIVQTVQSIIWPPTKLNASNRCVLYYHTYLTMALRYLQSSQYQTR